MTDDEGDLIEGASVVENWVSLLVVGTSIWVAFDASRLGARRGVLGGGFSDMGAAGWLFCCLLLWIVAFPVYLAARPKYRALRAAAPETSNGYYGDTPQGHFGVSDTSPYGYGADRFAPYAGPGTALGVPQSSSDVGVRTDRMIRLAELRDSGALTQAEFDAMKRDLVGEQ